MTENIIKENKFTVGGEVSEAEKKQPDKWTDVPYRKMYQGNATNSLANAIIYKTPPVQEQLELFSLDGKETYKATIKMNKNFSLSFLDVKDKPLVLSAGAQKLFTTVCIKFTEQVDYRKAQSGELQIDDLKIDIPLSTYAELRGLGNKKTDIDNIRKKATKELDELYNISIHYEKDGTTTATNTKKRKKRTDVGANDFIDSRVITKKEITNGVVSITLAPDIGAYLGRAYIMNYPMNLLKISTQQSPLAFFIGGILARHNNIGAKKPTDDAEKTIGIRTLLDKAIETGLLPSIEKQRKIGALKRRLIEPIEKALDTLYEGGVITNWGYTKGSRNRLSKREKEQATFDDLVDMYIFYEMPKQAENSEGV